MRKLLEAIEHKALERSDLFVYKDLYGMSCEALKSDKDLGLEYLLKLSEMIERDMPVVSASEIGGFYDLHGRVLLAAAPHDLDSFQRYLEWDRPPHEKFYEPRRAVLKKICRYIQMLEDDELDELFLSQPPRTGKSTELLFAVAWLIGRNSEKSNLYSAYSDTITSAFYNGILEILTDPITYKWGDVFPTAKIASTNAKEETLNIDRKKRYASLTCRSLYGTLNGACDCNGFLISDDLIGGIEEALNKDRLVSAWTKVENNLLTRAKEQAKILWCGTRWSMADPIGMRMELLVNDEKFRNRRYKIINLPALDDEDRSNFKYSFGVGFSDLYFQQKRASFERNNDMASWLAQYQQQPIERSGSLFESGDMRFYNGVLPDEKRLVRKITHVDPAFGGGDFVAAPIGYVYDDGSVYIPDVVFTDADKTVSQPKIINKILEHGLTAARFEANKSTESYKEKIEEGLKAKGYKLNITSKPAPNNVSKETRIFDRAPEIRQMYFLEDGKRSKEYSLFMQNVFSFKINGKNKHDDAPDSLAGLADMITEVGTFAVPRNRPW